MTTQERPKVISGGTWMDAERAAAEKAYRLAVSATSAVAEGALSFVVYAAVHGWSATHATSG